MIYAMFEASATTLLRGVLRRVKTQWLGRVEFWGLVTPYNAKRV